MQHSINDRAFYLPWNNNVVKNVYPLIIAKLSLATQHFRRSVNVNSYPFDREIEIIQIVLDSRSLLSFEIQIE